MPEEGKTNSNYLHNIQVVSRRYVTARTLGIAGLILVSLICGALLNIIPGKLLAVLLAAPVGLSVVFLIIRNPAVGVYLYYFIEFLRPQDIFSALRSIKIAVIIEVVTLISWTLHHARKKGQLYWPMFNWVFLAFVIVLALSTVTAVNNRLAFDSFRVMFVIFGVFFLSTNILNSFGHLNTLIWVLLITHLILAVMGISTGRVAGSSYMGDENDFALSLNFIIPFAFFYFHEARTPMRKIFIALMLTLFVLAVIASMSRGGWVGLIVAIGFCVYRSRRRLMTFSLIFFLGLSAAMFAPPKYWEEVETVFDTKEATAEARINYWKAAIEMYKDYPIIGVGGLNGGILMPEYVTGFENPDLQWGRTFHGTFPQVLAETGTAGMICYLVMIYLAFSSLLAITRRKDQPHNTQTFTLANAIMGSMLAYFAAGTFLSTAYGAHLWVLYILTFCLCRLDSQEQGLK